jgi:hypothetical protein
MSSEGPSISDDSDDPLGGGVNNQHLVVEHCILVSVYFRYLIAQTIRQGVKTCRVRHDLPYAQFSSGRVPLRRMTAGHLPLPFACS